VRHNVDQPRSPPSRGPRSGITAAAKFFPQALDAADAWRLPARRRREAR